MPGYEVRSAALNLFRKNSLEEQKADVLRAMKNADVVSLSELHGTALLEWARSMGFGVVKSKGDTAILYNAVKFEATGGGSRTLNQTEGPTGGMRSREAAYVKLRDKRTGETFWQIAAHTTPPHQGPKRLRQKIRKEQYAALSALADELQGKEQAPVLLAGDLNFKRPQIEGLNNATKGGVMHTLAQGMNIRDVDRDRGVNSDHALVTTTYTTGKGKREVGGPIRDDTRTKRQDRRNSGPLLNAEGDRLDPAEIQREYGLGVAIFRSDAELWKLLQNAIREGWDVGMFQAQLRETKWFKQHSDVWRQNMTLKFTDPKTYQERIQNTREEVANLAGQWGAQLTRKEVVRYAERAFLLGWSSEQILDHIAKDIQPGKWGGYEGQLAGIETALKETAFRNGVSLNPKQMQGWMKSIVRGEADVAEFQNYIRRMSAETFGAYGKEIRSGVDLYDLAGPYMNAMSDILELNPGDVNLFDKTIRKALSFRNEKGEFQPMSLTDFEDQLRADQRWQYTQNAKEQMQGYAVALGKMWGVL